MTQAQVRNVKDQVIIHNGDDTYSIVQLAQEDERDLWEITITYMDDIPSYELALSCLQDYDATDYIIQWGHDRNIIEHTVQRAIAQVSKTLEELAELVEHLNDPEATLDQITDDYGDILVTLIMGMSCVRIPPQAALHLAYQEIRNRKGKMVNGKFVKEA